MNRTRRRSTSASDRRSGSFLMAEVADSVRLTPHMQRVTLAAPDLTVRDGQAADQFCRLLFPPTGRARPVLPVTADWWQELLALPTGERPVLRNYTIRRFRPASGEVDIDFVLHGDTGPASTWAARARVGDAVGLLEQDRSYEQPPDATWQLLAGDETALPAIASILEELTDGSRAHVFVEVPTVADVQELAAPRGVRLHWVSRDERPDRPGDLVRRAVVDAELPDGPGYAWVAGESRMTTAVRRHLVRDRGFDKAAVTFCGYWRQHQPAYD